MTADGTGKIRTTEGRGKLFESILDTVGDTPAVLIRSFSDINEIRERNVARRKRSATMPGGPKRPRAPVNGRRQGSHSVVEDPP